MIVTCVWILSASTGASDLPPEGRSRFDLLVGDAPVPFPLPALMARIGTQLDASNDGFSPLKTTLIPLGRSLQRAAATPDFFAFPRVVAAVDGASRAGFAPLKDRLFFGYNERAGVLEVISYNETAGRFEFQVVRDYRAGAQPKLYYARRALCLACHQNAAPIFARPLWDETPANPAVAARLRATGRDYYGIALTGTDIAYLIDAAVERAGLFPLWQQVWREACDTECRAQWLDAALRYVLSGSLPDADLLHLAALEAQWNSHWPQGLSIPNSSIPNRDPLRTVVETPAARSGATPDELAQLAPIPGLFEPLNPRPPREHWRQPDSAALITGLAGLLNTADVAALDRALAQVAVAPTSTHSLPCQFTAKPTRLVFDCKGSASEAPAIEGSAIQISGVIDATSGRIDRLGVGEARAAADLKLAGRATKTGDFDFTPVRDAVSARLSDGRRWARLRLHTAAEWPPRQGPAAARRSAGTAWITLVDDYAAVRAALPGSRFLAAPVFDGTLALSELGERIGRPMPRTPTPRLPPAQLESPADATANVEAARHLSASAAQFQQHCGQCHDHGGDVPPNFLRGGHASDPTTVETRLDHCVQRIFYRLSQWRLAETQRRKTPMPPMSALAARGSTPASWAASPALAGLIDDASRRLRARGESPASVLAKPFEALRPCLPRPAADAGTPTRNPDSLRPL